MPILLAKIESVALHENRSATRIIENPTTGTVLKITDAIASGASKQSETAR